MGFMRVTDAVAFSREVSGALELTHAGQLTVKAIAQ